MISFPKVTRILRNRWVFFQLSNMFPGFLSLRAKEDTPNIMKLVFVFHQEEWIQHRAAYFFVGDHPYNFHANSEMSMEPFFFFSGDKYRIVKVLVVLLKGENETFHLLPTLNTAACDSTLLLTYYRFPVSKSLNMTAFTETTTGFHSYLYVVLSCSLQVTYANYSEHLDITLRSHVQHSKTYMYQHEELCGLFCVIS